MRPGRLDRILYVGPPDLQGREEIFKIKLKGMKVEENIDYTELATLVCSQFIRRCDSDDVIPDGRLLWGGIDCFVSGS